MKLLTDESLKMEGFGLQVRWVCSEYNRIGREEVLYQPQLSSSASWFARSAL